MNLQGELLTSEFLEGEFLMCQTTKVPYAKVYYVPLIMDSIRQQIIDRCAKIIYVGQTLLKN